MNQKVKEFLECFSELIDKKNIQPKIECCGYIKYDTDKVKYDERYISVSSDRWVIDIQETLKMKMYIREKHDDGFRTAGDTFVIGVECNPEGYNNKYISYKIDVDEQESSDLIEKFLDKYCGESCLDFVIKNIK